MIPLGRASRPRSSRAVAPLAPVDGRPGATRSGSCSPSDVVARRGGAAVREHRDGRLRGAGRRHRGAQRRSTRCGCAWSASSPAGHAPTVAVGPGEAIRIMTGAPMPDGADAIVMVERTAARRRRRRARRRWRSRPATTCAAPAATSRPATWCSTPGTVLDRRAPRRAREPRRRRGARRTRVRGSACSRPATSCVERGRSRPGRSATRTGRCCSRCVAEAGAEPVDLGIGARRRGRRSTATLDDAVDALRRGRHERRGVGGRLRLRERRARAHRADDPAALACRWPGRDQAGEAARLRRWSAAPRCSACPATRCRRS